MQARQRQATRGHLRIYFGAAAGVGKTFAMLAAAARLQGNRDTLVGHVETHGRRDTAALLSGLDMLLPRQIEHAGSILLEFDLDAALARHPALILVDELAHANAPGSRHPKRWQDIEELRDAGIDVFTTVNVQHLESLNDVVGGITGIRVTETVPDKVFDAADEVVLIDLPADELIARLKAGKVYQAPQAQRALQNFFRKGNLIALRELALRRTADRIETDVQAYRIEKSIDAVWKTDTALLACLGPGEAAEQVVRSAARLATQLGTGWHAIYVETPSLQQLSAQRRSTILKTLALAESLGALSAVLPGSDVAATVASYARSHNVSRILLGRSRRHAPWQPSLARRLATCAPEVDLIELGQQGVSATRRAPELPPADVNTVSADRAAEASQGPDRRPAWQRMGAVAASLLTALIATPLLPYLDLANIVMLFLLTVVLVAFWLGRAAAVIATVVSVAAFDFFFVPPRFSFAVSDFQYLVTFAVMLAVGLITGQLTAGLRYQSRVAVHREARSRALYEFARDLSGALQQEQVLEITSLAIRQTFRAKVLLLLPDLAGRLHHPADAAVDAAINTPTNASIHSPTNTSIDDRDVPHLSALDMGIAQWSFDRAAPAGIGTDTLPASRLFYLPLLAPMRTRGVLAIQPDSRRRLLIPEQRRHLDTFAALAAIALERVHYIQVAQQALVHIESERLRSALLAAVSHDLRTPLTSVLGMSETLAGTQPPLPPAAQRLAEALRQEARRMHRLVTNLLDMARIDSGSVAINTDWQSIEETIGSALRVCQSQLVDHPVEVRMSEDLPLVRFDAMLIEQVLCNLVENACRYTPPGSHITVTASAENDCLTVGVADDGPGLPAGREQAIFEKFTRGQREWAVPGVGLGLAICRAILALHGGEIHAQACDGGGALFVFTLPLCTPPTMPDFDAVSPGTTLQSS